MGGVGHHLLLRKRRHLGRSGTVDIVALLKRTSVNLPVRLGKVRPYNPQNFKVHIHEC